VSPTETTDADKTDAVKTEATKKDIKREISVEIPAAEVARETEFQIQRYQKSARLPGFRAGHVPASIIKQRFGDGRSAMVRAYAMTNPQEYFAECSEAFFSTNDFFPFTRDELARHDPGMFELLKRLWAVPPV